MASFAGKTVIVTGGAGALGRSVVDLYLARGANVVVCDVHPERLMEASTAYGAQERAMVARADVTDEESVKSLFSSAAARFGPPDVVVHCAGVVDRFDPAGDLDVGLWERVLRVNLTGAFLVTKHAVRRMEPPQQPRKAGAQGGSGGGRGGVIIMIGSNGGTHGSSGGLALVASQHGLVGLCKNTASFYGSRGIYCVTLAIGIIEATNAPELWEEEEEGTAKGADDGRPKPKRQRGINVEGMALMQTLQPGFVMNDTGVLPADVARYVAFLSEEGVARGANGSVVPFTNNWPAV